MLRVLPMIAHNTQREIPPLVCNHHRDHGVACSCVDTYRAIVEGERIPKLDGYCAVVRMAHAERVRNPEILSAYASDLLVHDRAMLTDYSGPFLWTLRECGTVLARPSKDPGAITPKGIANAFGPPCIARPWFWFDGRILRPVRFVEHAADLLAEATEGDHGC